MPILLTKDLENSLSIIAFSLDGNYCYTSFTKAHAATMKMIWGVDIEVGMNMLDLLRKVSQEDFYKAKTNFDRALNGENFSKIEEYGDQNLNRSIWENHYDPILNIQGKVIGLVVFVLNISNRDSMLRSINESNERLALAVKAANIGIWVWDMITKEAFWSDEILHIFKLNESFRNNLSFEKYLKYVHPDDVEALNHNIKKSIEEKSAYFSRHRVINPAGALLWVEAMGKIILENGVPIKMIGTIIDITERKKMEEKNEESSSLLQAALESTADGILVVDNDGTISAYNKRFLEIYDFTEEEARNQPDGALLEKALRKIINPEAFFQRVKELYANPEAESTDTILLTNGKILNRVSKPQRLGDKVVGRVWSFRDITEQKKAEESILKSELLFRTLTTNMLDMVGQSDRHGNYIYLSPSYSTILGYQDLTALVGTSIFEKIHPDDSERILQRFKNTLHEKVGEKAEFRYRKANGEHIWVETTGKPIIDEKGEVESIILSSRDISERKKNEEDLKHRDILLSALANATTQLAIETDVWRGVQKGISILGEASAVDHIYIYQNSVTSPLVWNAILEWNPEGIITGDNKSFFSDQQKEAAISLNEYLIANKPFKKITADIKNNALRQVLAAKRIKSILIFPLQIKNSSWGFIGFDETKFERTATDAEFSTMQSYASTLSAILEKKQIEKENKDWETRYEIVASSSGQIVYDYDLESGIITWSQSVRAVLGFEPDEIKSLDDWEKLIHPQDKGRITRELEICQQSGSSFEVEYRFKNSKGEYPVLFDRGFFLKDSTQKPYRMLGIMNDISQQRKAERELLESENRFRTLQEASFGGICLHDHGKILDANKGLSDLTGFSYEELLLMDGYSLISPESLPIVKEKVQANFELPYDVIGQRKDGSLYNLEIQGRMVPYYGKMIRVTEFRDVTLRKQAEQRILEQNSKLTAIAEDLKNKNQQLEEFTQIVSHNLRSPVSNILTLLDFYDQSKNNEEKDSYIKMLRESGDKMLDSLHELNEVLKINQNKDIERQKLSFEKVLNNVKQQLSSLIAKTGAIIKIDFSEAPEIIYPNIYLESIFINLLSNSLKYMHPNRVPEISFTTSKKDSNISIHVKDNGLGIDLKRYGHQVFKLRKTFHKHPESRGIGLFMIKNQIEALGGEIFISSEEGKGTEFIINFSYLPEN